MCEEIKHIGLWSKRLEFNIAEKVYAEAWQKENGLNSCTRPMLAGLMNTEVGSFRHITQRDAIVAATVIQWLGSNVGRCFVKECQQEIDLKRSS